LGYLHILVLSMIPVTELRGAIPIGVAMNLNIVGVYIVSVIGSTLVSIPLVLCFRNIINFLRDRGLFLGTIKKLDNKIERGINKMKNVSILGIILFVGIPLPTTGTWTASAIASILHMRLKDAFIGVLIGNLISGIIVSLISLQII